TPSRLTQTMVVPWKRFIAVEGITAMSLRSVGGDRLDSARAIAVHYQTGMQPVGYESAGTQRLDGTFAAVADHTRRAILVRLLKGEASVTQLAEPFMMSQPAISKHLKVLEEAGLVSVGRDGQRRPRRLATEPLVEASGWLQRLREVWEADFA